MINNYFYCLPLLAISVGLYNIEIHRIFPFEFDTNVYFTLLESLIKSGKALMPIVAGGLPSICDVNLNCSFVHPEITGQQLYTQMPTDYTSGISLLFIPLLINKILSFFYETKSSLIYFVQIYSVGASCLYLLSAFLIIKYSRINFIQQVIYILISYIAQILIIQFAANGIIGELYASVIIANVTIGLAITLTKDHLRVFYYICALFLGIALEAKISSIFPVGAIFSVLVMKSFLQRKNLFDVFILILLISLAKLIAVIYYYAIFGFSLDNLFIYFNSIRGVYSYNAGAGMSWGDTGIIKQLSMIFLNEKINVIIYSGIVCYGISLVYAVKSKNKDILLLLAFITYVLLTSLIYSIIFKFPYTRILSPFFALFPLTFLPLLEIAINLTKNLFLKKSVLVALLSPIIFLSYQISPPNLPLLSQPAEQYFEPFSKSYPDFKPSPSAVFLTSHFFGMPWDIYLSGVLDNQGPLNSHVLYGDQSIHQKIIELSDIYLIQSCRWGHCSKEAKIDVAIPNYKGRPASLKCNFVQPESKAIYRLYMCTVTSI